MENQIPMDMQGQKTKNKIKRKETRFDRLMKIHREFPDGIFTACAVDTENKFIYREKAYEIDKSVEAYLLSSLLLAWSATLSLTVRLTSSTTRQPL